MSESTIVCECRKCGHTWRITRSEMNASAGRWQSCPVCTASTCTECGRPLVSSFEVALRICAQCVEGDNDAS